MSTSLKLGTPWFASDQLPRSKRVWTADLKAFTWLATSDWCHPIGLIILKLLTSESSGWRFETHFYVAQSCPAYYVVIWYIAHDTDNDTRTILYLANHVNEKPMCQICMKLCMCCGWKIYVLRTRNGSRCKQLSNITVKGIQARIDTDSSWILLLLLSLHFKALIFADQRLEILLQGPQISIPPRIDGSLKRSVPEYACGNLSLWAQLTASVSVYHINRLHTRLKWSSIWHHTRSYQLPVNSMKSALWNNHVFFSSDPHDCLGGYPLVS